MRKSILFTFAVCLMSFAGEVWTGTLIDADCRARDAASKCEVSAATKSFGLVDSGGKFVALDSGGNDKVQAALKAAPGTDPERKASITGELKDGKLSVESVRVY